MKLNPLFTATLALMIASPALAGGFGVNPSQVLLKKKAGLLGKPAKAPKAGACVSFNGYWEGACRILLDGSEPIDFPAEVKITQHECDAIEFNGEVQPIGGSVLNAATGKIAGSAFVSSDDSQFDWNEDKSALVVRSHTVVRPLGETALIFDAVGASVIQDGALVFGQEAPGFKMGCSYAKH